MLIHSVLHCSELFELLLVQGVLHVIQQREFAKAVQDRVNHLCVKSRRKNLGKRRHFAFSFKLDNLILFLLNFYQSYIYLNLVTLSSLYYLFDLFLVLVRVWVQKENLRVKILLCIVFL